MRRKRVRKKPCAASAPFGSNKLLKFTQKLECVQIVLLSQDRMIKMIHYAMSFNLSFYMYFIRIQKEEIYDCIYKIQDSPKYL